MTKAQYRIMLCRFLELRCHPTLAEAQEAQWSGKWKEGRNSQSEGRVIHSLCLYISQRSFDNLLCDMRVETAFLAAYRMLECLWEFYKLNRHLVRWI